MADAPGYLGRVLDTAGEPVGTCFQVSPGVVATAWHVLRDAVAPNVGDAVAVDPLAGGQPMPGQVLAVNELADLAVIRRS